MCLRVWMGNVKVVHPNDHWLVMNKEWIFIQIKNYIYEGPQTTLSSSPHFPHWRFVTIMLVGFASVPYKWSHTSKSVICTSSHFSTAWKKEIYLHIYIQIRHIGPTSARSLDTKTQRGLAPLITTAFSQLGSEYCVYPIAMW